MVTAEMTRIAALSFAADIAMVLESSASCSISWLSRRLSSAISRMASLSFMVASAISRDDLAMDMLLRLA